MKLTFEGRDWEYDPQRITVRQAMAFQAAYGFTLQTYEQAIEDADPRALQCLYWLILDQNDVRGPLTECDFDITEVFTAISDASEALRAALAAEKAAAGAVPEVPTRPGGPPSRERRSPLATTRPGPGQPEGASGTA